MLVFLSENASRPFLKVNCISQYYLFQRAKQTEQNSKWDHIKFEIAFFSDRMKIIISFWLIASEVSIHNASVSSRLSGPKED